MADDRSKTGPKKVKQARAQQNSGQNTGPKTSENRPKLGPKQVKQAQNRSKTGETGPKQVQNR